MISNYSLLNGNNLLISMDLSSRTNVMRVLRGTILRRVPLTLQSLNQKASFFAVKVRGV